MIEDLEVVFGTDFGHFDLPEDPTNIPEWLFDHFGILNQEKNGTDSDDMTHPKKENVGVDAPSKEIDHKFSEDIFVLDIVGGIAVLDNFAGGPAKEL